MNAPRLYRIALPVLMVLPILAYRDAYRGYFDADDFGSLDWARVVPLKDHIVSLPDLKYPNGRPVGYLYYAVMARIAGFNFAPWVFVLELLGALNIALLWFLLRRLGFGEIESTLGCLFFTLSYSLFDAWWKPAFIYDVLATTFALLMMLAYFRRWWILSFLAFWLAMRSKEIGVVLPAVLLLYEMVLGDRKWKRVLPFFAPAAIYGWYGVWFSLHQPHTRYTLSIVKVWQPILFYASNLFAVPYAGLLVPLVAFLVRDRRLYFALGALACELAIYFLLPGRLLPVYLYLAMTAAAIAIAALATYYPRTVLVALLAWVPWQFWQIRKAAAVAIAEGDERREYVSAVRVVPDAPAYAFADEPASFGPFGGEYVIKDFRGEVPVFSLQNPNLPADKPVELLVWSGTSRRLTVSTLIAEKYTFVEKGAALADWQGTWPPNAQGYRGAEGLVSVGMYRPASAKQFVLEACGDAGKVLHVTFDDLDLPNLVFTKSECVVRVSPLDRERGWIVGVHFNTEGHAHVDIGGFGFR
jgi:hypothetical protein